MKTTKSIRVYGIALAVTLIICFVAIVGLLYDISKDSQTETYTVVDVASMNKPLDPNYSVIVLAPVGNGHFNSAIAITTNSTLTKQCTDGCYVDLTVSNWSYRNSETIMTSVEVIVQGSDEKHYIAPSSITLVEVNNENVKMETSKVN